MPAGVFRTKATRGADCGGGEARRIQRLGERRGGLSALSLFWRRVVPSQLPCSCRYNVIIMCHANLLVVALLFSLAIGREIHVVGRTLPGSEMCFVVYRVLLF
jgi:hypothetical protein